MTAGEWSRRLARDWRFWVLAFWLAACVLLLWDRWTLIRWFALSDTDDNLRIAQVRAWLQGQAWFDLRQYRLDPPGGADIHWSRLVDLPIAGIILALKPLFGGRIAEQAAVAVAPLLPMLLGLGSIALIARRLVSPLAFPLAMGLLLCAHSTRGMWAPLRIDHHGWQLALLALAAAALTDPRRARGGLLLGVASALSLAIGLEMLIYLAVAGGIMVLMWVLDRREAPRLLAYGASLAGGCALGFLLFASYANRAPVCDALSPVWVSTLGLAGAACAALALSKPSSPWGRLALAAIGGIAIAAFFALMWPHCLGRPENVSPELDRIWLSNVREARPIYRHTWGTIASSVGLPLGGLIGYALMLWSKRGERLLPLRQDVTQRTQCSCGQHGPELDVSRLVPWLALALLALTSAGLLLWQTRAGPAAQLLAVPGATALVWSVGRYFLPRTHPVVAATGIVLAFVVASGLALQGMVGWVPGKPASKTMQAVNRANARCPTLPALRPVARQPKGYVLTFNDLGPRLIAVTHHSAVAGPYHRNGRAILDVQHFFRRDEANALATVRRLHIDYVLICPNLSESTIYRKEAPKGFYVTLASGKAPAWLEPVPLPSNSIYKMWRVRR